MWRLPSRTKNSTLSDESRRIWPHEIFFGLFLLVTWVRLVLAAGLIDGSAIAWLAGIVLAVALAVWDWRRPTRASRRVRLIFYPLAMNAYYGLLRDAVPKFHPVSADPILQRADAWLFGGNLSLEIQAWVHPALTEALSACYFCFYPYLLLSIVDYCTGDLERLRRYCSSLFTIYGIGFLGYTLLPARGPWIAMAPQFSVPLTGGFFTRLTDAVVRAGCNRVDVFPSLHCAVTIYLLAFDLGNRRWRFWLFLVPCIGIWISTIYLRYHYAVDCLFGVALASAVIYQASRFRKTNRAEQSKDERNL